MSVVSPDINVHCNSITLCEMVPKSLDSCPVDFSVYGMMSWDCGHLDNISWTPVHLAKV